MSKELIPVNEILADMPHYDWQKYGYSLITEETFEGGFHDGDYEKDGVIHCGYCHTPKQVLHMWRGELRAFPIHCRCKQECLVRIEKERKQREHLLMAETCRQHALRYPYMHQWTFANDDGGSPQATTYFKSYIAHFEEMRKDGSGMFLFGPKGSGKTYAAAQIVNALCDKEYRCLVTSFLEIVKNLLSLNRENRQQYLDDICSHDLLVFDDFGGETASNFFDINMGEIVKTCYRKYIPMIVITPMAQDTLEQGLNATRQEAVDRMKERCYCLTLSNTKRYRQQTARRKEKMETLLGIKNTQQCL
jgi:DNA replication protein DnaC